MLEVIHVAASRHVVAILVLPLFSNARVDEVAGVLYDELTLLERFGSHDPTALGTEVFDL